MPTWFLLPARFVHHATTCPFGMADKAAGLSISLDLADGDLMGIPSQVSNRYGVTDGMVSSDRGPRKCHSPPQAGYQEQITKRKIYPCIQAHRFSLTRCNNINLTVIMRDLRIRVWRARAESFKIRRLQNLSAQAARIHDQCVSLSARHAGGEERTLHILTYNGRR